MAQTHSHDPTREWDALPLVLTLDQVANLLGVSRTSAFEAHRRGQVPGGFRVGRRLRFGREAVRAYIEGRGG